MINLLLALTPSYQRYPGLTLLSTEFTVVLSDAVEYLNHKKNSLKSIVKIFK